jgi:hypothetical protein
LGWSPGAHAAGKPTGVLQGVTCSFVVRKWFLEHTGRVRGDKNKQQWQGNAG